MKKDAEYFVGVYCDFLSIAEINNEIAQMAPHMLGRLVDHRGEIPQGSGFFHDVLSFRIDKMRSLHTDFRNAQVLLRQLTDDQYRVVFYWQYLIHTQPEKADRRLNTGKDVAQYLGVNYDWFKKTRQRGLDRINAELGCLIA